MKKVILSGTIVLIIAMVSVWNVNVSLQSDKMNGLMLANVEALATPENGQVLWDRMDKDCLYTITGGAGAQVPITLLGVTVITLTLDAKGEASYTYYGGKTECSAGGNQQCTARYCPPLLLGGN